MRVGLVLNRYFDIVCICDTMHRFGFTFYLLCIQTITIFYNINTTSFR